VVEPRSKKKRRRQKDMAYEANTLIRYPLDARKRDERALRYNRRLVIDWENEYGLPYHCKGHNAACVDCADETTCTRAHQRLMSWVDPDDVYGDVSWDDPSIFAEVEPEETPDTLLHSTTRELCATYPCELGDGCWASFPRSTDCAEFNPRGCNLEGVTDE
jgi:hypothetical protein